VVFFITIYYQGKKVLFYLGIGFLSCFCFWNDERARNLHLNWFFGA